MHHFNLDSTTGRRFLDLSPFIDVKLNYFFLFRRRYNLIFMSKNMNVQQSSVLFFVKSDR